MSTPMDTKPTRAKWSAEDATGAPGSYVVQRAVGASIEMLRSPTGRLSVFRSYSAASDKARRLNKDEATEAELRAKYAEQPAMPAQTLGCAIAKAVGRA